MVKFVEVLMGIDLVFVMTAEVKMPSGNIGKPIIEDNRDGTVSVRYEPKEEGLHELNVKYNGEHVQGEKLFNFKEPFPTRNYSEQKRGKNLIQ